MAISRPEELKEDLPYSVKRAMTKGCLRIQTCSLHIKNVEATRNHQVSCTPNT